MKYAGQRKIEKDIERRLKKEESSKKSNQKKDDLNKIRYHEKIKNKNNKKI